MASLRSDLTKKHFRARTGSALGYQGHLGSRQVGDRYTHTLLTTFTTYVATVVTILSVDGYRRLTGMLPSRNDAARGVPASAVFGRRTASRLTYNDTTMGDYEKTGLKSPPDRGNVVIYRTQEETADDEALR